MAELKGNCVEWLSGESEFLATLSQRLYINRIKKLQKKHPDQVRILAENEDGSILAKLPLSAMHFTIYSANNLPVRSKNKDGDSDG